jgi:hypothetical protein
VHPFRPGLNLRIALVIALAASAACGSGSDSSALDGVDAIVFIQRPKRNEMGDIFQYTSYLPTAHLMKLSPPTADGTLTPLCCDNIPGFERVDISSYDLSFDAREIVFSGRLSENQRYGLFLLHLDDGTVDQLQTDPNRDYTYPVFLPADKIMFMTNAVVEEGAPQHRDEYERGVALQLGVMSKSGTNPQLGPRNLSHRVFPTLMSDGRVLATQWDHLGDENSGHLMFFNPDMTRVTEAYGKQGGITNSYLKAREIGRGRVVAIGTSRDRTVQSGTLLDIRLGKECPDGKGYDCLMSEANASYRILTDDVPTGGEPSYTGVGRYYDAFPLNDRDKPALVVSWANGPVESRSLGAAGLSADFGIYLYDSANKARRPIFNDPEMWDIGARPLVARSAPPVIPSAGKNQFNAQAGLIGAMNVYKSSLTQFAPDSIFGVRVIEGFSGEEGVGEDFGLTEHEGAAVLGVAPVKPDGSFAGLIPANIPVHLQTIDKFGLSLKSEPVWFSTAPGESRFCGGCHEDRADTTVIQPGLTQAVTDGPVDLKSMVARAGRRTQNNAFTRDGTVGLPWDKALQPIFDANCVSGCHDGQHRPGVNPEWSITDPETGMSMPWVFDLSGKPANYGIGDVMLSGYSASHLSLMGPDMIDLERAGLVITGDFKVYVKPADSRTSPLVQKLNPIQQYPTQNASVRAFDVAQFPPHAVAVGHELTPDQYYLLSVVGDLGGQFYSRENAPNPTDRP